jgi:hypothetical protein
MRKLLFFVGISLTTVLASNLIVRHVYSQRTAPVTPFMISQDVEIRDPSGQIVRRYITVHALNSDGSRVDLVRSVGPMVSRGM